MSGPPSFSAEQCRAKAAELLEAARLSPYLDQKRLYQEIAEQWLAIADELERNPPAAPRRRKRPSASPAATGGLGACIPWGSCFNEYRAA